MIWQPEDDERFLVLSDDLKGWIVGCSQIHVPYDNTGRDEYYHHDGLSVYLKCGPTCAVLPRLGDHEQQVRDKLTAAELIAADLRERKF